jgi:hypothetical protein
LFADVAFCSFRRHADTGVLSLTPLKRLTLSTRVISFEPRPQPAPPRAEEVPAAAAAVKASVTPPPPVPTTAVEEGVATTKATTSRAVLAQPAEAVLMRTSPSRI